MANVTRTYDEVDLSFGPLKVGFMKRNMDLMKKVGSRSTSFDDLASMMPLIYASLRAGMGEQYPGDDKVDDLIDLVTFHDAILAVFEAIGFNLIPITPGAPATGEAAPAEG